MLAENLQETIYRVEKYENILCELKELIPAFFKEIEPKKPDFDHNQFIELDNQGLLQVVTVRENSLIGFHVSIIKNDLFHKSIKMAYVLFYYLIPERRGAGIGSKMIQFAESLFKKDHVKHVFMSRKVHIDNKSTFSTYKLIEENYTKALI